MPLFSSIYAIKYYDYFDLFDYFVQVVLIFASNLWYMQYEVVLSMTSWDIQKCQNILYKESEFFVLSAGSLSRLR